ncbi:MAG: NUMOD3 domain-containing DNA-binding protein [Nitrososphaeraceae archaeon]
MTKKGFKQSEETRCRMSAAQKLRFKEKTIWNNGVPHTSDTKENISKGMRRYWSEMSDEQKQKMYDMLARIRPVSSNTTTATHKTNTN